MDSFVGLWAEWIWSSFWQTLVLIGILVGVEKLTRGHLWPQVRLALWTLVPIKLLLPPAWFSPTGLFSGLFEINGLPFFLDAAAYALSEAVPALDVVGSDGRLLAPEPVGGMASADPATASVLLSVWLVGLLVFGTVTLLRNQQVRKHLRSGALQPPRWLKTAHENAAERVGLRKAPRLIVTRHADSALIFGVLRPTVCVPADMVARYEREQIEHVLMHECAHARRGDLIWQTLMTTLQVVYWFNPALILVGKHLARLREISCDLTVARSLRNDTESYRRTLALVATEWKPAPLIVQAGLSADAANTVQRVRALRPNAKGWHGVRQTIAIGGLLAGIIFVLPMGQPTAPAPCSPGESADVHARHAELVKSTTHVAFMLPASH